MGNVCKDCCFCLAQLFNFVVAAAGIALVIAGMVEMFEMGLESATNDGIANILVTGSTPPTVFVKCADLVNNSTYNGTDSGYRDMVRYQCDLDKAPYWLLAGAVAAMCFIRMFWSLFLPCTTNRASKYAFHAFNNVAMALSIVTVAVIMAHTYQVAGRFIDCSDFSQTSVNRVQSSGSVCARSPNGDNHAAMTWLAGHTMLIIGCALIFFGGLFAAMMEGCYVKDKERRLSAASSPFVDRQNVQYVPPTQSIP